MSNGQKDEKNWTKTPDADSSANSHFRDPVGSKSDAAVTTVGVVASIIAYIKGVLNQVATMITTVDEIPSETNSKTWNATALAAIETQATDAIEADDLDHLLKLDGATEKYPENCATDSILAKLIAKADPAVPSTFDNSTDSLEAIRDIIDTYNVADQIDLDAIIADITSAVDEPPTAKSLHDILHKDGSYTFDNTTDSLEAISDLVTTVDTVVDEIPSESNSKTFNATALQSIQDEAEDALEGEDLDHLLKLDGATEKYPENCATDSILAKLIVKADPAVPSQYDNSTDSLEAISDSIASGTIEIEADVGTTATNIIDAAALTHDTNDWFVGATLVSVSGQNIGQARPVVNFTAASDSVDVYPAFLNVPDAGDDFLLICSWRPHILDQQPDVAINTNANIAAVDIFDLNTAGLTYIVNSLRIKSADPGADTVTITLKELINDVSTTVDTFDITTANFGNYFSLFDMFAVQQLAGDDIQVTVSCDADGNYAITGQYQYSQTYTA